MVQRGLWKETRMIRLINKKTKMREDNNKLRGGIDNRVFGDVDYSDLHWPMNHFSYERFKNWLHRNDTIDLKIMKLLIRDNKGSSDVKDSHL
jgi:hypothetical protein